MFGQRRLLPQEQNGRKVVAAIQSRDEATALALIGRAGANVKWSTLVAGTTPLHAAAEQGFGALVAKLIVGGADVRVADKAGWTALHFATDKGHIAMALELVSHGADLNARNMAGWTPLLMACDKNFVELAIVLLGAGADANASNRMGLPPLHYAYAGAKWRLALELIARGARTGDVRRDVPAQVEGLSGNRLAQRLEQLAGQDEKQADEAAAYKKFCADRAAPKASAVPRTTEREEILATERALRSLLGCDMAATLAAQTLESLYQRSGDAAGSDGGYVRAYAAPQPLAVATKSAAAPRYGAAPSRYGDCGSSKVTEAPVPATTPRTALRNAYPQYAAAGATYAANAASRYGAVPQPAASRYGAPAAYGAAAPASAPAHTDALADDDMQETSERIEALAMDIKALLESTQIPSTQLAMGAVVGKGHFGHVIKAQWRGRDVCVKVLDPSKTTAGAAQRGGGGGGGFRRGRRPAPQRFSAATSLAQASAAAATKESTMREAETLGIVSQHPNVLTFYGLTRLAPGTAGLPASASGGGAGWGIVTELMNLGSLEDVLYGAEALSASANSAPARGGSDRSRFGRAPTRSLRASLRSVDVVELARQAASGVAFLHEKGVIHRDLACRNILADGEHSSARAVARDARGVAQLRVCVADFGLSAQLAAQAQTAGARPGQGYAEGVGAIKWEAPEVWSRPGKRLFSRASDVFAFGVCLYEMFVGREPWKELRGNDAVVAAVRGGRQMSIPSDVDPVAVELMRRCWARDPASRPSMRELEAALAARVTELAAR
jgi:serine/threonine protein kinase